MWPYDSTLGLSARAIAGYGADHPWDPADLLRCMDYCTSAGIETSDLQRKMSGRSDAWNLLIPEWDNLTALLREEMATATDGRAPRTYMEMKRVLAGGIACTVCNCTGRGTECTKCKGTGKRAGGRCRAAHCYQGADFCKTCGGRGYTRAKDGDHE